MKFLWRADASLASVMGVEGLYGNFETRHQEERKFTWNPSSVSIESEEVFRLMPPTPPAAQVLKSKNQMVSLFWMGTDSWVMAVPLCVSRKDESKPLIVSLVKCAGIQGPAKVDWVTVWFPRVTEITHEHHNAR